ncbi:MAG: hypothetical protein GY727_12415, partial [Gammaproteobacteria bacterium]|nr:hypothetical protein [Gammaproteobacteria bacterium]
MKKQIISTATFLILLIGINASANNLQISNVSFASYNSINKYAMLQFDISWDNSWRTSSAHNNWDAVWLFVKYRLNNGDWQHATLNATGANHTAPGGSTIYGQSDGKGVFMYRSANGAGTNTWTAAQLRWEYGTDGVADAGTHLDFKILGIEVVYV